MESDRTVEEFSRLLMANQQRLHGFVYSLIHDTAATNDILQEVSTVLWRKFDQFEQGTDFGAWSMKIARFTVLNWRRKQAKLPLPLDEETINALAEEAIEQSCLTEFREEALEHCLGKLPDRDRELLAERYDEDRSVLEIAGRGNRSRRAVYKHLSRLHQGLLDCIEDQLQKGAV